MRTLAPGRTEDGLTLVELLVVLLIIGMAASMVVFAVPRGQSDLSKAALQVERDIASLRDAAVTDISSFALKSVSGGYARYRATDGQWVLIGTTTFPGSVAFELQPEGGWELPEHTETITIGVPLAEEEEVFEPDVLFSSDGAVTPFAVTLRDGRDRVAVRIDPFGRIEEEGSDEE